MDYIININGKDILIEQNEGHENRSRLFKYYSSLLNTYSENITLEKTRVLETIVDNMTELSAKEKLEAVDNKRLDRLIAYANAMTVLTDEEKEIAEALSEVIDVTLEDSEHESILVNGNRFVYEKNSIDIKSYLEKLYSIGEERKGNTWTVYIDDEGELVIF